MATALDAASRFLPANLKVRRSLRSGFVEPVLSQNGTVRMRRGARGVAVFAAVAAALAAAAPARAARSCPEPGTAWQRATPAEAGMDAAKLQDAMDYGSASLGFAVRVYRHGCLVGEDRGGARQPRHSSSRAGRWRSRSPH